MILPSAGQISKKFSQIKKQIFGQIKSESSATIFRNMLALATGTITAKAIGFVAIPFITRIYTPDHFGVLSVFASITALIAPFGTIRFSSAIPLPKSDGIAINIFSLCLISATIVSLLTCLIFWNYAHIFLPMLSMSELLPYWWLVIVALAGSGLYETLSSWATREKAFIPLAKTKIRQSVISSLLKIGLGVLGYKPIGLLIGHVVSQAGGCTSLSMNFFQKLKKNFKHVSVRRLVFTFLHYSDFPKFRLPSQFLLSFSGNAPLLFSSVLFGKETTGQIGLALTTLALPIALFGNTTGQAFYAEIARVGRKNPIQIKIITKYIIKKLLILSFLPFLILSTIGPYIFIVLFGKQWRDAGIFASILSIYLLSQFISTSIVNILNVFQKQRLFLLINATRTILILIVFYISYAQNFDSILTLKIYSITLAIHYLIQLRIIFNVIK